MSTPDLTHDDRQSRYFAEKSEGAAMTGRPIRTQKEPLQRF